MYYYLVIRTESHTSDNYESTIMAHDSNQGKVLNSSVCHFLLLFQIFIGFLKVSLDVLVSPSLTRVL